ncbi:MAG: hypothetical protein HY231_21095 [Acidobacteria bacterium]|nr:hypothetical protein [Acidobacteriota bacterium]
MTAGLIPVEQRSVTAGLAVTDRCSTVCYCLPLPLAQNILPQPIQAQGFEKSFLEALRLINPKNRFGKKSFWLTGILHKGTADVVCHCYRQRYMLMPFKEAKGKPSFAFIAWVNRVGANNLSLRRW